MVMEDDITGKSNIPAYHPQYSLKTDEWRKMRDSYAGQGAIKDAESLYLPYTQGQIALGAGMSTNQQGEKAYQAYKNRARYHNFTREAVQMAIGMMHANAPEISLPEKLKNITTTKGENMAQLLRRINTEQLITGRIGLLVDVPTTDDPSATPYIATYSAERIVNWDNGDSLNVVPQVLNMVALDETNYTRKDNGLTWVLKNAYRILSLGDLRTNDMDGVYLTGTYDGNKENFDIISLRPPSTRFGTLPEIPFVFINSCDLVTDVDESPLLGLADLSIAIYQGDADHKQALHMTSQATLVLSGIGGEGDDKPTEIGSLAKITLGDPDSKAYFLEVKGNGLQQQYQTLKDERALAGTMGANTLDSTSRERESGTSMKIRVGARTADLAQVAIAAAAGLENALRMAAVWVGANPEEVSVRPNLEFSDFRITGQDVLHMMAARGQGLLLSAESMHEYMRTGNMPDISIETEIERMLGEKGTIAEPPKPDKGANVNPTQPTDD